MKTMGMAGKRFWGVCVGCFFMCTVFFASSAMAGEQVLYTAYNLWWEKPETLWCINYKTGNMIPAGTAVKNVEFGKAQARGAERRAISFVTVADGARYWVNLRGKFHPGKTIEDYKEMMFTTKDFAALTTGLSSKEINAIREGIVVEGMSKKAVLVSYGYPPEHKTPNLSDDKWTFWMNRFKSKEICFDGNDKAMACRVNPQAL